MKRFKFCPLEEADAIRLLVLHPSHETTAPLSGSLINTTLFACDSDFANGYLALSYVWGNTALTSSVRIEGIDVGITDRLAEALTQLRNACPGVPQRIWADAVCINQSDTAEKNSQVRLMGNIFSLAKATVIYLGPSSPGIETIFKAVTESKPRFVAVDSAGKPQVAIARNLHKVEKVHVKPGLMPSAAAIDELLQRPWFTRVWVTQELLLSRDAWVQCGALRVRWRELGALLVPILDQTKGSGSTALQQMLSLSLEDADEKIPDDETPMSPWEIRKRREAQEGKRSLSYILRMRQGCRSSDPKDMIFGYMGMHADRDEVAKFFTVDYEMPLRQLLISTARYIHSRDGLGVLLRCVKRPANSNWLNLPSWVPDWGIHEWPQVASAGHEMSSATATMQADDMLEGLVQETHDPFYDPKFIQHVSPILPRPEDFPQYVVDFLQRTIQNVSMKTQGSDRRKRFLEEENVFFWRNLFIGSSDPEDTNTVRLFPDSVWDPAAEDEGESQRRATNNLQKIPREETLAAMAYQILSFFMGYMGSRVRHPSRAWYSFDDAFGWNFYEGQSMRLAVSTAGFVLAVPAFVEVGDVFMSLHGYRIGRFGNILRPISRDTGEPCAKAFKWLCVDGIPTIDQVFADGDIGSFMRTIRGLPQAEVENDDPGPPRSSRNVKCINLY